MKAFPIIKTERLLLRQFDDNDLQFVFRGLSHPEVIKYYGVSFSSINDTEEQMKWYRNLEDTGTGIWWAISSLEGNIFYGATGFNNLQEEHKKAELGFWLLPDYWGKGFIREAVPHILNYAFTHLDLHRIEAFVEAGNSNSAKALQKLGFEKEGRMRDYEVKNGKFISVDMFGRLNE